MVGTKTQPASGHNVSMYTLNDRLPYCYTETLILTGLKFLLTVIHSIRTV